MDQPADQQQFSSPYYQGGGFATPLVGIGVGDEASVRTSPAASTGTSSTPAKVPIPRQHRGRRPGRSGRRVARACLSCRQRKTKCSGEVPECRQCRELGVECRYEPYLGGSAVMEDMRRSVEALSAKAADYEALLRDVKGSIGNVDERLAERIGSALARYTAEQLSPSQDHTEATVSPASRSSASEAVSSPSASAGALHTADRVEEDLDRGEHARATGFIGKNSEISWMQRVRREARQRSQTGAPDELMPGQMVSSEKGIGEDDDPVSASNYYLDDQDVSGGFDPVVDVSQLPAREHAEQLLEDYLATVHPFFPILSRPLFTAQFRQLWESGGTARPVGDTWLAILNIVFAIAARHAHLVQAPWKSEDPNDHLVYFSRARRLSLDGNALFKHPDLQQVQLEGLVAFYLLASDQINRAWRLLSLAVRSSITLGFNLKNTSETMPVAAKESRYRVWWSLYTLEHLLEAMTGRASHVSNGIATAPFPVPYEEERYSEPGVEELMSNQSLREDRIDRAMASSSVPPGDRSSWLKGMPFNLGLLHLLSVDLAMITQEIISKVYTVTAVRMPRADVDKRIDDLRTRIDQWSAQLPDSLNFLHKETDAPPERVRAKLGLAFQYYSARITLGRPYLCLREESREVSTFSHRLAMLTLESASRMLDLIPDAPDPLQLYQLSPWWCILHYMMQATTVLLLELSFGNLHAPQDQPQTLQSAKKAIRWLHAMSAYSVASHRAWQLCDTCLRRIARGLNLDVGDMPTLSCTGTIVEPYSSATMVSPAPFPQAAEPYDWNAALATVPTETLLNDLATSLGAYHSLDELPNSSSLPPSVSPAPGIPDVPFPFDPTSNR